MKKFILLIAALAFVLAAGAQTAKYGALTSGTFEKYVTAGGVVIASGDSLTIGPPAGNTSYQFITQSGILAAPHLAGVVVKIDKLKTYGNKKRGWKMYAQFKGYGAPVLIDIEQALKAGEIKLIP